MKFKIKTFISGSGERFSQLYKADEPGFPLFYPTAFIARSIRSHSTHETQKVYLAAIKRVCEWESNRSIDIASRFHARKFLSNAEIDDLTSHIRARKAGRKGQVISSLKYNTYVTYAAMYLRWLAMDVITDSNTTEIKDAVAAQDNALLSRRKRKTGSKSARERHILAAKLPDATRDRLLDLFEKPFEGLQETQSHGQRFRNTVMLRILYETGMRIGELLSLKLKSLIEAVGGDSAYLKIERNHHDVVDTRLNQPVAKTVGRIVPISEILEKQIEEYCGHFRAEVPNAGFADEDFIFIVHRGGRSQGQALPKTSFDSGLANLKKSFPTLMPVHPHLLRHDWNYRFSMKADLEGMTPEEECTSREELMGWQPGSKMSRIYDRRHIQEKAYEIGLKIAFDTARITK